MHNTVCACAIAVIHEQWMCLGIQRNTHITGNNLIPISVKIYKKIWGGVPSFNRNLSRHQLSCLLVLRLLSYASSRRRRRRKHRQNGENIFGYNIHINFGALLLEFLVDCLVFTY